MKNNKQNNNPIKRKIADIFLITVAAVVLFLLVLTGLKINNTIAKTVDSPRVLLTMQLINGSDSKKASSELMEELYSLNNDSFEIKIVEKDNFDLQTIGRSFIIARSESNIENAERLAAYLGMKDNQVFYRPLEYNKNYVNLSLVIGEDYQSIIDKMKSYRSEKNES